MGATSIRVPDEDSKLGDVVTLGHRVTARLVRRMGVSQRSVDQTIIPSSSSVRAEFKVENDSNRLIHVSLVLC